MAGRQYARRSRPYNRAGASARHGRVVNPGSTGGPPGAPGALGVPSVDDGVTTASPLFEDPVVNFDASDLPNSWITLYNSQYDRANSDILDPPIPRPWPYPESRPIHRTFDPLAYGTEEHRAVAPLRIAGQEVGARQPTVGPPEALDELAKGVPGSYALQFNPARRRYRLFRFNEGDPEDYSEYTIDPRSHLFPNDGFSAIASDDSVLDSPSGYRGRYHPWVMAQRGFGPAAIHASILGWNGTQFRRLNDRIMARIRQVMPGKYAPNTAYTDNPANSDMTSQQWGELMDALDLVRKDPEEWAQLLPDEEAMAADMTPDLYYSERFPGVIPREIPMLNGTPAEQWEPRQRALLSGPVRAVYRDMDLVRAAEGEPAAREMYDHLMRELTLDGNEYTTGVHNPLRAAPVDEFGRLHVGHPVDDDAV